MITDLIPTNWHILYYREFLQTCQLFQSIYPNYFNCILQGNEKFTNRKLFNSQKRQGRYVRSTLLKYRLDKGGKAIWFSKL